MMPMETSSNAAANAAARPDALERACSPRLREFQSARRVPSVAAAVVRDGTIVWWGAAGLADVEHEREPTLDTQYRIGSITKTFTAALVLQLHDAGRLDLDDRLGQHLPGTRHGDVSLRRMLAHLSGLQREAVGGPGGEVWETLEDPDRDSLLAGFEQASKVLPPGHRWHYSNLAYALLGEVVARNLGTTWESALSERLLGPLGLRRTTVDPVEPRARGYLVDPYADAVRPEPLMPLRGTAPAGQLWSTPADLASWAAFLADPDPAVLSPDALAEMRHPQVIADLDGWTLAWGLGLMLYRRGERILHGHAGAMPGFLASMVVLAKDGERAGAVVMANTSAGADVEGLAVDLLTTALEEDPREPAAWRPGEPPPPEVVGLLGRWWSEGSEHVFRWREGRLEASPAVARELRPQAPAVFEPIGADRWTTVSGREEGESLRAVRAGDGSVRRLYWAGYPFTREPQVFGATQ
jgi:CubicO group peptidase (beta-lactamase class C family)